MANANPNNKPGDACRMALYIAFVPCPYPAWVFSDGPAIVDPPKRGKKREHDRIPETQRTPRWQRPRTAVIIRPVGPTP